jgi:hypothetical protein
MIDKELLAKIGDLARKDEFYTTSDMDSPPIRALREADLIRVYDMHSDGRVRWMLTAEGLALLKG